ncbi:MAG TPA: N-acetylmuramoyl-L-alanine amidase [Hyphomonas sp.]|nr:N-acetylmuramoyl-L-alanine amidase [Hyphomonas sp.]
MQIETAHSPNHDERREEIDMLVLHYTGMEDGESALAHMCNPEAKVSAHYMIWEDGRITRLVDESRRAWHAGVASWQGDCDLNSRSIGIEIVNGGHNVPLDDGSPPPYAEAQIHALILLSKRTISRYGIPQTRIVGHSDIAPDRKDDPGEHFPWARLAAEGIGLYPEADEDADGTSVLPGDRGMLVDSLQRSLIAIGYGLEATGEFDEATAHAVNAFQRRFLPQRLGRHGDALTLAHIAKVQAAFSGVSSGSSTSSG